MTPGCGSALPRRGRAGPWRGWPRSPWIPGAGCVSSPVSAERLSVVPRQRSAGVTCVRAGRPALASVELAGEALTEVAAGRAWTATMSMAFAGGSARSPSAGSRWAGRTPVLVIGGMSRRASDRARSVRRPTDRHHARPAPYRPRGRRRRGARVRRRRGHLRVRTATRRRRARLAPGRPRGGGAAAGGPAARAPPTSVTDSVLRPGEVLRFEDESP